MKFTVNGITYPLSGYKSPDEYTILGVLSYPYYLCEGKDGSTFALYLPHHIDYANFSYERNSNALAAAREVLGLE